MTVTEPVPGGPAPLCRVQTVATVARLALPYAAFAVLKRIVPATRLARWAWTRPRPGPHTRDSATRVTNALVALRRRRGPSRGDCLESALVLYRELSRAGAYPELVMGLGNRTGSVTGHAWVEVGGAPVGEASAALTAFTEVARFGEHGRRVVVDAAAMSRGR